MELILNLAWILVAIAALACWQLTRTHAKDRFSQLFALATLLFILFPVISITDDLWAAHNPAETDVLIRRDDGRHHHTTLPQPAPVFLVTHFHLSDIPAFRHTRLSLQAEPNHEAPSRFRLFIRPPPAL